MKTTGSIFRASVEKRKELRCPYTEDEYDIVMRDTCIENNYLPMIQKVCVILFVHNEASMNYIYISKSTNYYYILCASTMVSLVNRFSRKHVEYYSNKT